MSFYGLLTMITLGIIVIFSYGAINELGAINHLNNELLAYSNLVNIEAFKTILMNSNLSTNYTNKIVEINAIARIDKINVTVVGNTLEIKTTLSPHVYGFISLN